MPVGRPWIAGEPWHGGIRAMGAAGQPPIRPSLLPCADPAGQAHAPDWGKSAPHPGVSRGFALKLSAGQRRFLGMHDTPQLVEVACAPMPIVPAGQPDGATVARHPDAARDRPCPYPLGRCAQWRAAHCLPPARAPRSQKSPHRPPAHNTLCRNSRSHSLHTLYTTPEAAYGWISLRKGLPIPATVAVRTVQGFPIHSLAPSCHRVFARGGTIN